MEALIGTLLADHAGILAALDRVRRDGFGTRPEHGALRGLRALLEAHVAREDEHLYPVLRGLARERPHLRLILAEFEEENARLKRDIVAFYERWDGGDRAGVACAADFGRLAADLRQRIHREEATLFREALAPAGQPPRDRTG